ncbi:MAG: aspartate aminotransferase family protein [Gemmatimonadota bacterium]
MDPEPDATALPGPRSRALARRLAAVECRTVTRLDPVGPIFWAAASGGRVRDADGNEFIDLTGGFGVAAAGHAHPAVAEAIARQARTLAHGLGDVQPAEAKVALLERLAELAPGDLGVTILGSAGAEAVEAALKTAVLATGRPGIVAFEGGYHGLTYGALAASGRGEFREPFERQLYGGVRLLPFPRREEGASVALAAVAAVIDAAAGGPDAIGAVLVEPVQGRGGMIDPPADFLPGLRALCDASGALLIADEIFTGFGRTGRWFAVEHAAVVPDVMTLGKALTGALPLSAAVGRAEVMEAWPASTGESLHTSTFLGNPISCAAALAHLDVIEREGLVERARALGELTAARLAEWAARWDEVDPPSGLGLMRGAHVRGEGAARIAGAVADSALARGVILLTEGPAADTLALTPALAIEEADLIRALDVVGEELERALGNG